MGCLLQPRGKQVMYVPVACSEPSCPQCRVPMQSRRDAKRDTRFDRLLKVLYSNISRYEAQARITSFS